MLQVNNKHGSAHYVANETSRCPTKDDNSDHHNDNDEEGRLTINIDYEPPSKFDNNNEPQTAPRFGNYQLGLLILTQIGYFPVAASLLSTSWFEPSKQFCFDYNRLLASSANWSQVDERHARLAVATAGEFWSPLFEWRVACGSSTLMVRATSGVMCGAIGGSFVGGYLADRFGRKKVVVGMLLALTTANAMLVVGGTTIGSSATIGVLVAIGACCGGYMTTNVVFLVEAIRESRVRMLIASLNGWPLGMTFAAAIAWMSGDWRLYFSLIGLVALAIAGLIQCSSFESVGFLLSHNEPARAASVFRRIGRRNDVRRRQRRQLARSSSLHLIPNVKQDAPPQFSPQRLSPRRQSPPLDDQKRSLSAIELSRMADKLSESTINRSPQPDRYTSTRIKLPSSQPHPTTSTYLDLIRGDSADRRRLVALLYCFGVSSIVSFGLYFSTDTLPGSRYANLALMGSLKFGLGLVPAALAAASALATRKRIVIASVGAAAAAAWTLAVGAACCGLLANAATTALSVGVTAAIDPAWKIIHLYSVELFPIRVRSQARALCNVVARLGSMAAPMIILLRSYNPVLPYWLFSTLLTVELLVLALCMPAATVTSHLQVVTPHLDTAAATASAAVESPLLLGSSHCSLSKQEAT